MAAAHSEGHLLGAVGLGTGQRLFDVGPLAVPELRGVFGPLPYPLTDARTIRQGDFNFTSVGTATLCQLVSVYDGFLEIERRDFVRGESVGPNWVVPVPAGKEAPFLYANRAAASKAPGPFPQGAKIAVTKAAGKVRLEFPPARAIAGASPIADYEIEAVHEEADVVRTLFTRYVYGPGVFFDATKEKGPIVAEFDAKLFPKGGRFFFRARAHEIFGKFNAAIES